MRIVFLVSLISFGALSAVGCGSSDAGEAASPASSGAERGKSDDASSHASDAGAASTTKAEGAGTGQAAGAKAGQGGSTPDKAASDHGGSAKSPRDEGAGSAEKATPICLGLPGSKCPGLGRCDDDDSDDCDPARGDANCDGVCTCEAKAKCHDGQTWNADPMVCHCEDAAASDADAGTPAVGDVQGESVSCGGSAPLACPGAGTCQDDADDDCDPVAGGKDCAGTCSCNVAGVCRAPAKWNPAPNVCACEMR